MLAIHVEQVRGKVDNARAMLIGQGFDIQSQALTCLWM